MFSERAEIHRSNFAVDVPAGCHNRALCNRQVFVRDNLAFVDFHRKTEPATIWTRAERAVKTKAARLEFFDVDAAVDAGKFVAEKLAVIVIARSLWRRSNPYLKTNATLEHTNQQNQKNLWM